ncbi:MAG: M48 family metalloprotease [Myxococcota bacterium]|nr:M48 family metalloprotease [Myxococcota bacterium]
MVPTRLARLCACLLLPCLVLSLACRPKLPPKRVDPEAKPERPTILYTEHDDRRVGEEQAAEVAAELGLLEDPALTAYVEAIGARLVALAPPRAFDWSFAIVDQFEPNAFALPGGQIFVSRGLLALANDESELAAVLGHEIVHSAARHAAGRQAMERFQSPFAMAWFRFGELAAYSRDQEREADRDGQALAARAGYDPLGLARFLEQLRDAERLRTGHSRLPGFFATHPGTTERIANTATRGRSLSWQPKPGVAADRAGYLDRIDGLVLGDSPSEGLFRGERFLHPDLDLHIRFPQGWKPVNTHRAVGAVSPDRTARVLLTVEGPAGDPELAANAYLERESARFRIGVTEAAPVRLKVGDAYRVEALSEIEGQRVFGQLTFIPYNGLMYLLAAVTPATVVRKYVGQTRNIARTLRPLTPEERDSIEVTRLRVVKALEDEDLFDLSRRTDNAWDVQRTAALNGVFTDHRFLGGELVKIARAERYEGIDAAP